MFLDYRQYLLRELDSRTNKNPQYSLRSFARDLDLSPSRLSEILNHKQGISFAAAKKLMEKINLGSEEKDLFCALVEMEHARALRTRRSAEKKVKGLVKNFSQNKLHLQLDVLLTATPQQVNLLRKYLKNKVETLGLKKPTDLLSNRSAYHLNLSLTEINPNKK